MRRCAKNCLMLVASSCIALSCKPTQTIKTSTTASLEGGDADMCPVDSYSPLGEYLEERNSSTDPLNGDDFAEAMDDSEGYLQPCDTVATEENNTSDSLSLVSAGSAKTGGKIVYQAGQKILKLTGSQGTSELRILAPKIKFNATIIANIKNLIKNAYYIPFEEGKFAKIYEGAKMISRTSFSLPDKFAKKAFDLANANVSTTLSDDVKFINEFLERVGKMSIKSADELKLLKKDMKHVKEIREHFRSLRFAFQAVGETDTAPKHIEKFAIVAGHLKDGFDNGSIKTFTKNIKLLNKMFAKGNIEEKLTKEIASFVPKSTKQMNAWIAECLQNLEKSAKPGKSYHAPDYHAVRKKVSSLTILMDAARQIENTSEYDQILKVLTTINGKMGAMHDSLTIKRVSDSNKAYEKTMVEISPDIRELFQNFLTNFNLVI